MGHICKLGYVKDLILSVLVKACSRFHNHGSVI